MRKALPCLLAVITIVLVLLASCATSDADRVFSEEECRHTLEMVLTQATDTAIPALFVDINNYKISMVPSRFSYLDNLRMTIPGMDRLLHQWESDVLSYIFPYFEEFSVYLETLANNYEFTDPVGLINAGAGSVSDDIRKTHGEEMAALTKQRLEGLDTGTWAKIVTQYNSWAKSMDNLYGQKYPAIDPDMPYETLILLIAHHLADVYLNTLTLYEVLIRTTPDPDMDPVAARILGLE